MRCLPEFIVALHSKARHANDARAAAELGGARERASAWASIPRQALTHAIEIARRKADAAADDDRVGSSIIWMSRQSVAARNADCETIAAAHASPCVRVIEDFGGSRLGCPAFQASRGDPAARRLIFKRGLAPRTDHGSGRNGRQALASGRPLTTMPPPIPVEIVRNTRSPPSPAPNLYSPHAAACASLIAKTGLPSSRGRPCQRADKRSGMPSVAGLSADQKPS